MSTVPCLNPAECGISEGGYHRAGTRAAQLCMSRTSRQNSSRSAASSLAVQTRVEISPKEAKQFAAAGDAAMRKAAGLKGSGAAAAGEAIARLAATNPKLAAALRAPHQGAESVQKRVLSAVGEAVGETYRAGAWGRPSTSGRRIAELLGERAAGQDYSLTSNAATPTDATGYDGSGYTPRAPRETATTTVDNIRPQASGVAGEFASYLGIETEPGDDYYFSALADRNEGLESLMEFGFDSAHAVDFAATVCDDLGIDFSVERWNEDASTVQAEIADALAEMRER